jgi:hypothetical protein
VEVGGGRVSVPAWVGRVSAWEVCVAMLTTEFRTGLWVSEPGDARELHAESEIIKSIEMHCWIRFFKFSFL